MAAELVRWEEDIAFARFPPEMEGLRLALRGATGRQLEELGKVPDVLESGLDEAASKSGGPTVVQHTIVFDLPPGWNAAIEAEFRKLNALIESGDFVPG